MGVIGKLECDRNFGLKRRQTMPKHKISVCKRITLYIPHNEPRLLIDGGVFINNPGLNLLLRARKTYPHIKQQSQLLVSVGTGDFSPYKKHLKKEKMNSIGYVKF